MIRFVYIKCSDEFCRTYFKQLFLIKTHGNEKNSCKYLTKINNIHFIKSLLVSFYPFKSINYENSFHYPVKELPKRLWYMPCGSYLAIRALQSLARFVCKKLIIFLEFFFC